MSIREWVSAFVRRWRREVGTEPTPIDFAHNIPLSMRDGEAMQAMVEFMQRREK